MAERSLWGRSLDVADARAEAAEVKAERYLEALKEIEQLCPPWSMAFGIEEIGRIAREAIDGTSE